MNQRALVFFRRILRHRPAVLTAAGLVILVAAAGALRVRVDFSVEPFFLPVGPARDAFEAHRRTFPREDTRFTLFWQDARPPGVALYRDMERAARLFEDVGPEDVRWIGSVLVPESDGDGDDASLSFVPLLDSVTTDQVVAARLARHRDDPLLAGFLWDPTQRVFAIHGYLDQERNHDAGRRAVEEALTRRLAALDVESARLVLGGLPVARSRAPKLLAQDLGLLAGAAFVISGIVLFYFLRDSLQVALLLASVAPAYLCTVGLMGFLGKPISVLTSFIPVVVLVVGMSDAVHLVADFRRRLVQDGASENAVARTAMRSMDGLLSYCYCSVSFLQHAFSPAPSTTLAVRDDVGCDAAHPVQSLASRMTAANGGTSRTRSSRISRRVSARVWLSDRSPTRNGRGT